VDLQAFSTEQMQSLASCRSLRAKDQRKAAPRSEPAEERIDRSISMRMPRGQIRWDSSPQGQGVCAVYGCRVSLSNRFFRTTGRQQFLSHPTPAYGGTRWEKKPGRFRAG